MTTPLVLVTGASGYIAAHVVKVVQEAGYRVRGTVRSLKNEEKVQPLYDICPNAEHKLELVEADLLKEDSWKSAVEGCTYVIHVASPFPLDHPKDENEIIRPAVEGTLSVLRAAAKAGTVKRVVLTSSGAAVGWIGGNKEPLTEKNWSDLSLPGTTAYAKSKNLAERAAWDFLKALPANEKFELAVVNPVFVVGPPLHKAVGSSITLIRQVVTREMAAIPKFNLGVCDVRDVAKAHLACMTLPEAAGNRHIVITETKWLKEMADIIREEFSSQGYNPATLVVPNVVLWLASWVSTDADLQYKTLTAPIPMDNTRLREVLKIEPTDPRKSLVDMVYGMIEAGHIAKTSKYKGPPAQPASNL